MVESSDAFTPGPALGLPLVVSEGQISEHPLIFTQLLLRVWSFVNSYNVRPDELTRIVPMLVLRTPIFAARLISAVGRPACAGVTADTLAMVRQSRNMWMRFTGSPPGCDLTATQIVTALTTKTPPISTPSRSGEIPRKRSGLAWHKRLPV
jgi:hypothetical protein